MKETTVKYVIEADFHFDKKNVVWQTYITYETEGRKYAKKILKSLIENNPYTSFRLIRETIITEVIG